MPCVRGGGSSAGFEATVQTILISGVGRVATLVRSKAAAENGDDVDDLVNDLMDENDEQAND